MAARPPYFNPSSSSLHDLRQHDELEHGDVAGESSSSGQAPVTRKFSIDEPAFRSSSASSGVHSYYLSTFADSKSPAGAAAASASTFSLNPTASDDQRHLNVNLPHAASSSSLANDTGGVKASSRRHKVARALGPGWRRRRRRWVATLREALWPESLACRLYLGVVLLETFFDIVIEAVILHRVNQHLDGEAEQLTDDRRLARSRVPVYLTIFGIAHVFQFALALDAVYYKNVLQFLFLAIFNGLFFMYAVIQIFEVRTTLDGQSSGLIPTEALTITIPVVIALAEVAYVFLGYRIYRDFGWQVFKFIGADRKVRKLFTQYQIFECLVRFDGFFWLGFSVQLISLVLSKDDAEFKLTIAAVPLCFLLLYEGHLGARYESKLMMRIFGFGLLAAMVYFCYKLFRIWTQRKTALFKDVYQPLTVFASLSIVMLILTAVWTFIVYLNFNGGLKTVLERNKEEKKQLNQAEDAYEDGGDGMEMDGKDGAGHDLPGPYGPGKRFPASANPYRMSID